MLKANKIIYWVSTAWLSLGMLSTALAQLLKVKTGASGTDSIAHLGYPAYFLTLLGVWKILGVVAVLIPALPVLKEWAYAGFFFAMTGAAISHIAAGDALSQLFPSLLLLALTLVSWYYRPAGRKTVLVK